LDYRTGGLWLVDEVDAQPLVVPNQKVLGLPDLHDVVYVATENNTVYAIDLQPVTIVAFQRSDMAPVSR
jgi:hypothetical protein